MRDDINQKVINIFSRHKNELPPVSEETVKFYAGFNYVKLEKDNNGKKFNSKHLINYSQSCSYIVRVMKECKGEVVLYNYDVLNEDLFKFIRSFEDDTLGGVIIEIDKYFPEDLA
ncbi:MAG: hypothetical protein R3Y28_06350 [Candidatus Gastranaerophilales bacterium]